PGLQFSSTTSKVWLVSSPVILTITSLAFAYTLPSPGPENLPLVVLDILRPQLTWHSLYAPSQTYIDSPTTRDAARRLSELSDRFLNPLFCERCMAQALAGESHHSVRHRWRDQRRRHLTDPRGMIVGLDHFDMHWRNVAIARQVIIIEIRLLHCTVLDANSLGER